MFSALAVVTDSTAYFPDGLAERRGIRQVQLHVLRPSQPNSGQLSRLAQTLDTNRGAGADNPDLSPPAPVVHS